MLWTIRIFIFALYILAILSLLKYAYLYFLIIAKWTKSHPNFSSTLVIVILISLFISFFFVLTRSSGTKQIILSEDFVKYLLKILDERDDVTIYGLYKFGITTFLKSLENPGIKTRYFDLTDTRFKSSDTFLKELCIIPTVVSFHETFLGDTLAFVIPIFDYVDNENHLGGEVCL